MRKQKIARHDRLANEVALFVQQVGRKAQKGVEPNDRKHDHELERRLKHMSPIDIDKLIRTDDDE